ncbi:MAG: hypothetical protein ACI9U2_000862, partial [Bradymonadia bacterium]
HLIDLERHVTILTNSDRASSVGADAPMTEEPTPVYER